ncbi:MAG: hypothetical protein RBT60_14020 [Candidatus Krumholzibacteria bacterium]|jgi:uncharacterized protein involved in exopolysaccharide biosynthesis|nr:hypothetical protein [Candidatus Krumholzibacteria bacterium]
MSQVQYPVQRSGEDRMDLRSLIEVLIRRRWIIALVALPVIFVATLGTLRTTQMYLARTTLMIEVGGPRSPYYGRSPGSYDMVLSSAAELVMSLPVAAKAAMALADSLPQFQQQFPQAFAGVLTVADLQDVLHGGVNSRHVGESNLISLNFTHPTPQFALIAAGALADAFIDFNSVFKSNSPAVEYYSEQIAATQAEIDSLIAQRTRVLQSSGLLGVQADLKMSIEQIRGLENQYFSARSRREGLEARLSGLEQSIADDGDFVPTIGNSEALSLNRLKGELDTRLATLLTLRQSYQDDSVFIQRELRQIDDLRDEIARERERYLQSIRINLAEARSVEQSFLNAHLAQAQSVEMYPDIRGRIENFDLRIDGLRRFLQNLQQKHGEMRLVAEGDLRISDVIQVEEPVLDVPVGRGRRILYLIISIVLAVAMGLVAAFFVESNDHRIYDRRRAELYLEVPVLGSLPDTSSRLKTR